MAANDLLSALRSIQFNYNAPTEDSWIDNSNLEVGGMSFQPGAGASWTTDFDALRPFGLQSKYNQIEQMPDGRLAVTLQRPGGHKYDTMKAIYAQGADGKWALEDGHSTRQKGGGLSAIVKDGLLDVGLSDRIAEGLSNGPGSSVALMVDDIARGVSSLGVGGTVGRINDEVRRNSEADINSNARAASRAAAVAGATGGAGALAGAAGGGAAGAATSGAVFGGASQAQGDGNAILRGALTGAVTAGAGSKVNVAGSMGVTNPALSAAINRGLTQGVSSLARGDSFTDGLRQGAISGLVSGGLQSLGSLGSDINTNGASGSGETQGAATMDYGNDNGLGFDFSTWGQGQQGGVFDLGFGDGGSSGSGLDFSSLFQNGGGVYYENDGSGNPVGVNTNAPASTGGNGLWDRLLQTGGGIISRAITGGGGSGGATGSNGTGGGGGQGLSGMSPFQLAWALSQYNKLDQQAKQARSQYGEAANFQQQQITRTTDLADALKGRVLSGLGVDGKTVLPSQGGAKDYIASIGDDGVGQLAQMMGGDRASAQALLQRVQSGNPGQADLQQLDQLAALREGRNTNDKAALDTAIGNSTTGLRKVQGDLGTRQTFTDADIQKRAGEIESAQIGGVDRALTLASSQGFADSLRRGMSDSTQAGDTRDNVVRRFADVYGNLKNSSRTQAASEINNLNSLQQGQRTNALGEEKFIQDPELQSRIATYRPDNTAVDAAKFGAEYEANQAGRQQNLYQILSGNANATTNNFASGSSRGADRRLQATQQADATAIANQSSSLGPLLSALSSLNQQANASASDMTKSATSGAKDATLASGVALNRVMSPVAQTADNVLLDLLRALQQGGG